MNTIRNTAGKCNNTNSVSEKFLAYKKAFIKQLLDLCWEMFGPLVPHTDLTAFGTYVKLQSMYFPALFNNRILWHIRKPLLNNYSIYAGKRLDL